MNGGTPLRRLRTACAVAPIKKKKKKKKNGSVVKKVFYNKPNGKIKVGRPRLRCLEDVERDI